MIRILHVSQYLQIGGLETLVVQMCCRLKGLGVEVQLLCFHEPDRQFITVLEKNDIRLRVILEKSRLNAGFFREITNFIRRNSFDVVHAHSGCHLNAVIASKIAGVKIIYYTAHGMPIFTSLKDRIEDSIAAFFTTKVISVSSEIDLFLKKWFLFSRCEYETIFNGVDISKFSPIDDQYHKDILLRKYNLPSDCVIFGSVGRLSPEKNYSLVLRVVRRLLDKGYKNIVFVLVGDGNQKQVLLELANQLDILDNIYFLGIQYDVNEILPLFKFFVLSSLTEGTSISLLESQACGIPAVVTDVGGNSFVVSDGINGFLCSSNNEETMTECIEKLINNSALSSLMGEKARERAISSFSVESMMRKYLQLYNRYYVY